MSVVLCFMLTKWRIKILFTVDEPDFCLCADAVNSVVAYVCAETASFTQIKNRCARHSVELIKRRLLIYARRVSRPDNRRAKRQCDRGGDRILGGPKLLIE